MSKPARKLSLRKETLRQLDAAELARVGGGTIIDGTIDWVILRDLSKPTQPTRTDGGFYFNYYYLY